MEKYTGLEIAVIGMSGRFPGAMNVKAFWENLKKGSESISFFSDEEVIAEGENPNLVNNPSYIKAYSYLQNKEYFDSEFFNYRPDEAGLMDPQIRVFHECVWEAIEDAGCDLNDSKNKVGLFAGSAGNLNWEVYARIVNANELVDDLTLYQVSNARLLSSRISYALNLKGPSLYLDSACSTSLVAIHQACKSLLTADCNIAIAGGVTILNKSKKGYLYNNGLINSRDGHCRPFDADATGTVGGEGAGAIVLKTLKHAQRDGDNIYAIIKGSGISNDGSNKVGFVAPSVDGQVEAIMIAQKWGRVEPRSVTFIETHGTATKLGDPIEVEALNRVFGESKDKYCVIGSVKSNIGHLDAAAGVAGFIKTVLSIKHQQIPPTLHFKNANPSINFKDSPFYVNAELQAWKKNGAPLRAGVSSFGIGGTNAHVILEEAPESLPSSESRAYQLFNFSAKTPEALKRNIENFRDHLNESASEELSDIAFTLNVGRMPFPFRKVIVCDSRTEALEKLSSLNFEENTAPVESNGKAAVIFMFSGQGSQYVNMCRDLYHHETVFRVAADKCFDIVQRLSGKDIRSVVFTPEGLRNSDEINNTALAQPLIFTIEYALSELLKKWGIQPDAMIGHSIGEYTAACLSGLFSLEDALFLVTERGALMQRAPAGVMMSISISENELAPLLTNANDISLAAINSSNACVVSGTVDSIDAFKAVVEKLGHETQILKTSHAFHSASMDGVLSDFEETVRKVKIGRPQIPFVSNLTGRQASETEVSTAQYWVKHLRHTVKFSEGIENLFKKNKRAIFIEVGPGKTLSNLVQSNIQRTSTHKVVNLVRHRNETVDDSAQMLSALGELWSLGLNPDWTGFYEGQRRRKVSLPTYAFEKIKYPANVDSFRMISEMISGGSSVVATDFSKGFLERSGDQNSQSLTFDTESAKPGNAISQSTTERAMIELWQKFFGKSHINANSNFFDLGGDSLKVVTMIGRIHKRFNVDISIQEFFDRPSVTQLVEYVNLVKVTPGMSSGYSSIPKAQEAQFYTLSAAQSRLYFLYEFDRTSLAYSMPHVVKLTGDLDKVRLNLAFKDLVNRHESLRTCFEVKDGQPMQKVLHDVAFEIEFFRSSEQEANGIVKNFTRPFDLSKAPLIRVGLIEIEPYVHLLIVDLHHIIADGISLMILSRDFMMLYNNELLDGLRLQYKDYAAWQQSDGQQAAIEKQRIFWLNEFSSDLVPLALPTDFARPLVKRTEGNSKGFNLSVEETIALKRIAEKENATLFMVMLAAYNVFLSKICAVENIVVGTPTSGRIHADLEQVIGMFVNTIPIQNYPTGDLKFDQFLANVKSKTLSCFDNQDFPYEELINELKVERDTSRNPIFDVVFSYENFGQEALSIPGLVLEQQDNGHRISKFDLLLTVFEGRDQLFLTFEYCTALFKEETITRFSEFLKKIIVTVIADVGKTISEIDVISDNERDEMARAFDRTKVGHPLDKTLVDLFAEQVQRTPNNIAVKFEEQSISYAELDKVSTRLAVLLRRNGITREQVVGLLMDRSLETVIGMIAILKAGGAYLPIDVDYPEERINYLVKNSGATVVLTSRRFNAKSLYHDTTLFIEDADEIDTNEGVSNVNSPADLCYVIYTSGTTGNPKGVMVEHVNVVGLFFNDEFQYDFGPDDVWTMFHSHCFDFSVWEIYGALLFGGRVVIIPKVVARDAKAYLEVLKSEKVTVLNQTPSAFYNLIKEEALHSSATLDLRHVILGGESLSPGKLKSWKVRYPHVRLVNMYGITETTVFVTYKEITDEEIERNISNIGRPIPALSCYVFDRYQRLVPKGIVGELYIGGSGVTRGYLGNVALTGKRFIQNPFNPGERLYRSGDLTKVLDNCDLEYLGRIDEQVQLRGFRIELGEIEHQLLSHDLVREVLVLAKELDGDQCLVAYYVSAAPIQSSVLRRYLMEKLPDYMVPSYYVHLEGFQLTVNGKLDKRTLPEWKVDTGSAYVAPVGSVEKKLVAIWSEILKIDETLISADSNFFELGGHSIRAVHLMNKIQQDFSVKIELRNIFDASTIQKLGSLIEASSKFEQLVLTQVVKKEYHPTSPAQERLFFNQAIQKNSLKYNISVALEIAGELNIDRLTRSFQRLIDRHESLRTGFTLLEDGVFQRISQEVVFQLELLKTDEYASIDDAYRKFVRPFDLSDKSLMRCGLYSSVENRNILLVDIHHIICDGISLRILINDFKELYSGAVLAPANTTYVEYTYWLNSNQDRFRSHENFWKRKLGGELPRLDLPVVQERDSVIVSAADSSVLTISDDLYQEIKNCTGTHGISDFMLLLSAFYIMLSKMSGSKDIIVGTDVVGRTQSVFRDVVGTFINILPLRVQIDTDNSFADFLKEVRDCVLEAFDHQDFQFDQIVALHGEKERMSRSPIFDVHFSFANTIDSDEELTELAFSSIDVHTPATTQYELKLEGREHAGKMDVAFIYSTDLYSAKTIELFITYYQNVLTTVVRDPFVKISNIKLKTSVPVAQNSGMQQR